MLFGENLPQNPIFIVGYPRSGTTLLQALLATQAGVFTLPETHFFNTVYPLIKTDEKGFIELHCLDRVFTKIFEKMSLTFDSGEIEQLTHYIKQKMINAKHMFEFIVLHYLTKEVDVKKEAKRYRWLEKTPNHAFFLNNIISFYPDAQFINITRHPVPAVFSRKNSFPFNKNRSLTWLAQRWNRNLEMTERFALKNPDKLYLIKYEDLTENLENELKKVFDFLNLELNLKLIWNHSELIGHFILPNETWKKNDVNKKIVNQNEKYRSIISKNESQEIEQVTESRMKKLGYKKFFD